MDATSPERVRSGNLLYTDAVGHDACDLGVVAARSGKPSMEVLRKAVLALKAMEHRGGDAGDGVGGFAILQEAFFESEAKLLRLDGERPMEDLYTAGTNVN